MRFLKAQHLADNLYWRFKTPKMTPAEAEIKAELMGVIRDTMKRLMFLLKFKKN